MPMVATRSFTVFRHSPRDGLLVLLTCFGLALLALAYIVRDVAGWPGMMALASVMAFVICTNYQCVAHNFVHHEFFVSRTANTAFSILNTLALGFSQTVFREHHRNHHRYNNSPVARDGVSPGDLSSLSRFSDEAGRDESLVRYALLSPLRADIGHYAREAVRRGKGRRLAFEAGALTVLWLCMAFADWRSFVLFYVPMVYFGHVLTYAEGYFEHHRAVPGDRHRNAVSCYSRLYNIVWFNNGYHQEHHSYPAVHWTRIPAFRDRMLAEDERRVVPYAHWVNF